MRYRLIRFAGPYTSEPVPTWALEHVKTGALVTEGKVVRTFPGGFAEAWAWVQRKYPTTGSIEWDGNVY